MKIADRFATTITAIVVTFFFIVDAVPDQLRPQVDQQHLVDAHIEGPAEALRSVEWHGAVPTLLVLLPNEHREIPKLLFKSLPEKSWKERKPAGRANVKAM